MTAADFRRLALRLPEVSEGAHMGHADFRVTGRVFATLGYPRAGWAMVKLTPAQQDLYVRALPEEFVPVPGAWGRAGCTNVRLRRVAMAVARDALTDAWRNRAPQRLIT